MHTWALPLMFLSYVMDVVGVISKASFNDPKVLNVNVAFDDLEVLMLLLLLMETFQNLLNVTIVSPNNYI